MSRPPPRLRLRVSPVAESRVRAKHPWLFGDSVREQNRTGELGELAIIYDRQDQFLAVGLYDPDSPIRVRVLHAGKPQNIDAAWWRLRLQQSVERREGLCDALTTACRLVHGESDGWPGLVLDRYDTTLVLKIYTAAWLPRLVEITALIVDVLRPSSLILRLSRNIQSIAETTFARRDGAELVPAALTTISEGGGFEDRRRFRESGLWFEADVVKGQKTGFFLDQRENRRHVEELAAGREVLNGFSFSGGFSLYAARGGATAVTDLDISGHALDAARRNFALNQSEPQVARCRHECVQADAFAWVERNTDRKFDLIVLDPPSLAKRETERAGAIQAYAHLTARSLPALRKKGVLVAASCSAHVTPEEFFEAVLQAARGSGRAFRELDRTGHPPDHPAEFPEARYLKCLFLELV